MVADARVVLPAWKVRHHHPSMHEESTAKHDLDEPPSNRRRQKGADWEEAWAEAQRRHNHHRGPKN